MATSIAQLEQWMAGRENEHIEFKEARTQYDGDNLVKYSVALANERGGKMILGVTDKQPRRVVGTRAFSEPGKAANMVYNSVHFWIEPEEIQHPDGRVLIFHIPSRPPGVPLQHRGTYWMRGDESCLGMQGDRIKRILDETGPDYSAQICKEAVFEDLDLAAIERFRAAWIRESRNEALAGLTPEQLLADAELFTDGGITFASLILFGTHRALGRHLAQSEVIFEYRNREASIPPSFPRKEYRQGLFLFIEELWNEINLRNEVQPFQNNLLVHDIPTFNERVVREAILNALCHRDYRLQGSVFIRQYPRRLSVESPGGLPEGVTLETILWRQVPRNRRIAEAIARCDMVERGGQGVNLMFQECIRESKPTPNFNGTDDNFVFVTLRGEIQDARFARFMEQIGKETLDMFDTRDFLALDAVHREQRLTPDLKERLPRLVELGIVESVGRGKYILARRLYTFLGQKGAYTRKRGLDRETNKELLLRHIREYDKEGSKLDELMQVLPALSRYQVQSLLRELDKEHRAHYEGKTSAARWHIGASKSAS